jgi:hypothetical protein
MYAFNPRDILRYQKQNERLLTNSVDGEESSASIYQSDIRSSLPPLNKSIVSEYNINRGSTLQIASSADLNSNKRQHAVTFNRQVDEVDEADSD